MAEQQGYRLILFDAYRPQKAVNAFISWAEDPSDQLMKASYYPDMDKSTLFSAGFLARKSAHSRGSTVDLSLVNLDGTPVDMGSPFDFFGPISAATSDLISNQQQVNRNTLREAMIAHGFKGITTEWWHFSLIDEPWPSTYFDFDIT